MHHPAKDDWVKTSSGSVATFLGRDRAAQAELAPIGVRQLIARRHAEVGVQMPGRKAQRTAFVKLVSGGALGHGVHGAYKFVASGRLLVEQEQWDGTVQT